MVIETIANQMLLNESKGLLHSESLIIKVKRKDNLLNGRSLLFACLFLIYNLYLSGFLLLLIWLLFYNLVILWRPFRPIITCVLQLFKLSLNNHGRIYKSHIIQQNNKKTVIDRREPK